MQHIRDCPRLLRLVATIAAVVTVVVPQASAFMMLTFDSANFQGLTAQIVKINEQVTKMQQMVNYAKDQLKVLNDVSDTIGKVKGVMSGGIKDMIGAIADEAGLQDVFEVGKAIQDLATDSFKLAHDIQNLPDEAKAAWNDVGLSVKDVQDYLSHGMVYDAYSGLGVDSWKRVMKDPMKALEDGEVSYAIGRSEAYIDASGRQKAYADYIAGLPEDERNRRHHELSFGLATTRFDRWWDEMDSNIAKLLKHRVTVDKITENAAQGVDDGKGGKTQTVIHQQQVTNAQTAQTNIIQLEGLQMQQKSDEVGHGLMRAGNDVMRAQEERERVSGMIMPD